jgi:general transcription factor 3C polypeptide 3 (transcription factor C subunit 4)
MEKALAAMVYAAHLRNKDVSGWMNCAAFALDLVKDDEDEENLQMARLCFSAALRADPTHVEARLGKAAICHRRGHLHAAIAEYKMVLRTRPNDLDLVRKLAEACVDNKNAEAALPSAIEAYSRYFAIARANTADYADPALWHDINIYVELYASLNRFQDAVHELRALSRWLVGRASEHYWDQWQSDDREWDIDNDRRSQDSNFAVENADMRLYGSALPLELRVRLAIYRIRLGDTDEAFVRTTHSLLANI